MNIIGISGKIGTGKSTLGRLIAEQLGAKVRSFGDLLKEEVAELFNFNIGYCYTQAGKNTYILHSDLPNGGMTVRQILQWYGSDVIRAQDPTYWSRTMKQEIDKLKANYDYLVIDDVRFPDEARLVVVEDGILVRLEPYTGWQPGEYADHQSEIALDDWKYWDFVCTPEYGALDNCAKLICIYNMEANNNEIQNV